MTKTILITGGGGMIATSLIKKLEKKGWKVKILTRKPKSPNAFYWNINEQKIDLSAFEDINGIIHLAGANIAEKRWTKKRKQELYNSRILSTKLLYDTIEKNNLKINFFVSASAIGYYGSVSTSNIFTESSPPGKDFLAKLCVDWEKEALKFNKLNTRTAIIRTGIVFSKTNGAFPKLATPIKYCVGASLGSGKQIVPWIHINDICDIYIYIIENKLSGIYNAVASEQLSNQELTKKIALFYHRPLIFQKLPAIFLKLVFGEMSLILLEGSKISNKKIKTAGFCFKYDTICDALNNLINHCP